MKKKLFVVLSIAALVVYLGIMPAQATKIADFNVLDSYITVGESFDVEVSVYDDGALGDLTGFGFDVDPAFSLTLFSFDSYAVGPDFTDQGMGSYVAGLNWLNFNAGQDVLLATLSFTAGALPGTDTLEIEGIFDGWDHGLYYVFGDEGISGAIDIDINRTGQAVPEPATMFLLGSGLFGLAGFRKKFRK